MAEFYNPGQLETVVPFLPAPPRWLVLGGPADADEAQTARRLWPTVQIVGVEPNPEAVAFQRDNGWPADAPLYQAALVEGPSISARLTVLHPSRLRNATTDPALVATGRERRGAEVVRTLDVNGVTLDDIDGKIGPFADALLWLDVEGAEAAALRGARYLLARRAVLAANVELPATDPAAQAEIAALLAAGGLSPVHDWNVGPLYLDRLFVRKETT